ncbi:Uncharacterised protein [Nocardia otitidiscaviarum]|uniref:Uncharacterized protein n=1 Tax=Nocardia otitidiscaviarum TaxID=1823 RepID=A0A378Y8P1_9NOCA|nr:Uncharacterised protein [Nocardia otitidiscaviarum]
MARRDLLLSGPHPNRPGHTHPPLGPRSPASPGHALALPQHARRPHRLRRTAESSAAQAAPATALVHIGCGTRRGPRGSTHRLRRRPHRLRRWSATATTPAASATTLGRISCGTRRGLRRSTHQPQLRPHRLRRWIASVAAQGMDCAARRTGYSAGHTGYSAGSHQLRHRAWTAGLDTATRALTAPARCDEPYRLWRSTYRRSASPYRPWRESVSAGARSRCRLWKGRADRRG